MQGLLKGMIGCIVAPGANRRHPRVPVAASAPAPWLQRAGQHRKNETPRAPSIPVVAPSNANPIPPSAENKAAACGRRPNTGTLLEITFSGEPAARGDPG